MGRIRSGVRDQGQRWVDLGICQVEELDLDPTPPPGFCVLQFGPSLILAREK